MRRLLMIVAKWLVLNVKETIEFLKLIWETIVPAFAIFINS